MKTKLQISDQLPNKKSFSLRVLERGSLGPSTVTLIALLYVATCGGHDATVIVMLKLFPEMKRNHQ